MNEVKPFKFDENVANVFSDMISRSVPGYNLIIQMIESLTGKYIQENSNCYDLGCSLGAATISMMQGINKKNVNIFAIDNSKAMINKCRDYLQIFQSPAELHIICSDINNINIVNASIVIMNFTLQFLKPEDRDGIIKKIYNGLKPGGILILSEKISFQNMCRQELNDKLHLQFKLQQGYSHLEISQKRNSLENVLARDNLETHKKRIESMGFTTFENWFRCYNFVSMLAIK